MDKFCIDCKHVQYNTKNPDLSLCTRKQERDLVSGEPKKVWCNVERLRGGLCGLEGKHFEPSRIPAHDDEVRTPHIVEYAPDGRRIN